MWHLLGLADTEMALAQRGAMQRLTVTAPITTLRLLGIATFMVAPASAGWKADVQGASSTGGHTG